MVLEFLTGCVSNERCGSTPRRQRSLVAAFKSSVQHTWNALAPGETVPFFRGEVDLGARADFTREERAALKNQAVNVAGATFRGCKAFTLGDGLTLFLSKRRVELWGAQSPPQKNSVRISCVPDTPSSAFCLFCTRPLKETRHIVPF